MRGRSRTPALSTPSFQTKHVVVINCCLLYKILRRRQEPCHLTYLYFSSHFFAFRANSSPIPARLPDSVDSCGPNGKGIIRGNRPLRSATGYRCQEPSADSKSGNSAIVQGPGVQGPFSAVLLRLGVVFCLSCHPACHSLSASL